MKRREATHEKISLVIMRVGSSSFLGLFAAVALLVGPAIVFGESKKEAEKAGAVLFRDKGCAFCHGAGGVGGKKAPALTAVPGDKLWTPEKLTDRILNGGQKMPPFRESVTDDEVSELIAYLRAKDKPVPPPTSADASAPAPSGQSGP
jgi:mono/diheme cytochrome c family protein